MYIESFKNFLRRDNVKQKLKFYFILFVIVIVLAFALFTVMKYQVEGEKEVPFKLGKIIVISSAATTEVTEENTEQIDSTEQSEEENYLWKEKVVQTNDVYIYLDKNKEFKEEQSIKKVKIENIKILENVKVGKIQVYMPNSLEDGLYKYTNEFIVNSSLTYIGASTDNKKALEICNQGGCVCISFANMGLGEYKSNDDVEITQDASILEKMNIANEDLKFKVSFDLIIEVNDKSYITNLVLELPIDEVVGQKETHKEITDFSNVIFKRL